MINLQNTQSSDRHFEFHVENQNYCNWNANY